MGLIIFWPFSNINFNINFQQLCNLQISLHSLIQTSWSVFRTCAAFEAALESLFRFTLALPSKKFVKYRLFANFKNVVISLSNFQQLWSECGLASLSSFTLSALRNQKFCNIYICYLTPFCISEATAILFKLQLIWMCPAWFQHKNALLTSSVSLVVVEIWAVFILSNIELKSSQKLFNPKTLKWG